MSWWSNNAEEQHLIGQWHGKISIDGIEESVEARMRVWRIGEPVIGTIRYEGVTATGEAFSGRILCGSDTTWYFDDEQPRTPAGTIETYSPLEFGRDAGLKWKRDDGAGSSIWRRVTKATRVVP